MSEVTDAAGALRALAGVMASAEVRSTLDQVRQHDMASLIACIAVVVEGQQQRLDEERSARFKAECLAEQNPHPDSIAAATQRVDLRERMAG